MRRVKGYKSEDDEPYRLPKNKRLVSTVRWGVVTAHGLDLGQERSRNRMIEVYLATLAGKDVYAFLNKFPREKKLCDQWEEREALGDRCVRIHIRWVDPEVPGIEV